ncbi:hypothetical protein FBR6_1519 [Lactiplantibacillus plantarum]|nr:hypothetical protein FBR6_1519 [Lactiplantibacillus plantarum]WCL67545.1 hypothetical protein MWLp12_0118 [Lactiplantibacillus plantarum]
MAVGPLKCVSGCERGKYQWLFHNKVVYWQCKNVTPIEVAA